MSDVGLMGADKVVGYLGMGPVTIHRWCRDGRLPCIKLADRGGSRLTEEADPRKQSNGPAPASPATEMLVRHSDRSKEPNDRNRSKIAVTTLG